MADKRNNLLLSFLIVLLWANAEAGNFREKIFMNGPCFRDEFRCLNEKCIDSRSHCDGKNDCGDNSDEDYCSAPFHDCPKSYPFYKCIYIPHKCIPRAWMCDGITNCEGADDESNCGAVITKETVSRIRSAELSAVNWILKQVKPGATTRKWGLQAHRIAVALHLTRCVYSGDGPDWEEDWEEYPFITKELAYEISIQLLSRLALKPLKDVSTTELALYINAMVVSCIDPRKFHVVDLVSEVRSRIDYQKYTNPFVMLALCNAGEKITGNDIQKLTEAFWANHRELWTDTQAIAVMALACAATQDDSSYKAENLRNLTMELKRKQFKNGTVENLKTTALVMQALFASEAEDDENNFDEEKAFQQILQAQLPDGSFGDIINTYFVLPLLSYRSLVNVSSDHCKPELKEEEEGLKDLANQIGQKWRVRYTLWIGDERDIERTLKLRVPANTSFYGIMQTASEVDTRYRFQYSVKNGKPYIYSISGIQDDPENGQFWFPYFLKEGKFQPTMKSPADLIPEDNAHLLFWYKCGAWLKNIPINQKKDNFI